MKFRSSGKRYDGIRDTPNSRTVASILPRVPLWLLVLVTLTGTLAMHMFVPALGQAARELGATTSEIESTITLYVLGLALGQLAYGPVSDQIGRRPTLLFGLILFTAAGIACMTANSIEMLVGARFAQALGGCSGLLLGRAIVRDTSSASETMHRLATMQLITMIGPGLAPLIGAIIATTLGWRWIFAFFAALGVAGLITTWQLLPETRKPRNRDTTRSVVSDYLTLVRAPVFLGCVVGGGCATASLYAFVAAAPFLFGERFGESLVSIGIYLFFLIVGVSLGNVISGRLGSRTNLTGVMLVANVLSLVCSFLLVAELTLGSATALGVTATMFVYCVGAGLCGPAVVTKAMSIEPSVAGSASGIYGCGQMLIGALCTAAVGLGDDPGVMAAIVLAIASVIGQFSFQVVRTKSA